MYIEKFVHSQTGKIIMSVLLGIGLATFFRSVCIGKRCQFITSPPIEEIEGQTYKFDDKCYKFEKNPVSCDKTKNIIKIA